MKKIDAINEILFMIGESFINSMDEMSFEAQSTSELIDIVTREICSDQEPFNIYPYTFQSNSNGEIYLPDNVLSVDVLDAKGQYRAIRTGDYYRIKDICNNTYTINESLSCECKIEQTFEELDPIIQNYIIKKTAVKKISVDLGNKDLISLSRNDLEIARISYMQHNIDISDINFDDTSFNSLFKRYYEFID